ncbi:hypothetical protein [Paenibacillus dakarensis]|uniref:hypothetical protein n=1 Tax=Paenibacillus dakarensis TaxID=1527293 RepID=UPI000AAAEF2D|nr:hypothetical protein [Paenibacillus dakarensis]
MDEVQRFIANNQHQFGYIMGEASRQWIAKDPVGALTVGDCHSVVQRHGQYHELLGKIEQLEKEKELTLKRVQDTDFTASGQPAMVFYEMLTQLFEQNGGKNFLTITLEKRDKSGRYSVTIRNLNGELSEAEKLDQMEQEAKKYRKALQKIVCLNISMPDEVFEIANNALENEE